MEQGAANIFMKDIYYDLFLLEQYCLEGIAHQGIALVMNDLENMVHPKHKDAKCWGYDMSDGARFGNISLCTPVGGKEVDFVLKKQYEISWIKNGSYWFAEIKGEFTCYD